MVQQKRSHLPGFNERETIIRRAERIRRRVNDSRGPQRDIQSEVKEL
jgi:hypothetical protein